MKTKQLIKLLEENGWEQVRMHGDHRIFKKKGARLHLSVPGGLSDEMRIGTLNSILREAGLK